MYEVQCEHKSESSKFNRLFEIVSPSTDVQTQVMRITIGPMMEAGRPNTLVVCGEYAGGLCNRPPLALRTHRRLVHWLVGHTANANRAQCGKWNLCAPI